MNWLRLGNVLIGGLCVGGCSYFLDFETAQCETTSDCHALGPAFSDTMCVLGTCQSPTSSGAETGEGGGSSGSQSSSTGSGGEDAGLSQSGSSGRSSSSGGGDDAAGAGGEDNGAAGAGGEDNGTTGGCVSTAQCIADNLDEPYVCPKVGEACLPLKTQECPQVFGDFDDENAVYFGAFLNMPASAPLSQMSTLNVRLAVDEFNNSVGGLPGGPLGKLRPLVAVVCRNDPALVETASAHLLDELEVPAVLAHLASADIKDFFVDQALPHETFVMNPGFADNSLTTLSTDGLFWHVIGDIRDVAPAYAPLLTRIEAHLEPSEDLRVAMLISQRFAEQSIADTVVPLLRFNGKTVTQNGANFYTVTVPALADEPAADYSDVNSALLEFKPHVIIAITREELVYKILPVVEDGWDAAAPGQERPFYVLPTALSANLDLLNYVAQGSNGATSENKRLRMLGVAPASAEDLSLYDQFLIRFRSANPQFVNPGGFENFYDAVYLIANAMFAAGSVPSLRGPDVARGMQRIISGSNLIDVGPTHIADGFSALAAGGNIRLNGTLGPADFDPGLGARRGNGSIFCFQRNSGLVSFAYDVLRYQPETQTLSGELGCIPDL